MDEAYLPLARFEGLLVEPIGDELLVFDSERNRAHSLNDVAARVWRACDGQRDLQGLQVECGVDGQALALALERLRAVHLLTDDPVISLTAPAGRKGVSRRVMLRRSVLAGAGVGIAIPVVRSITAPSIAMAASGRSGNQVKGKAGFPCSKNSQCSPSSKSFCNSAQSFPSCQRQPLASCSHTSSCQRFGPFGSGSGCNNGICSSG